MRERTGAQWDHIWQFISHRETVQLEVLYKIVHSQETLQMLRKKCMHKTCN